MGNLCGSVIGVGGKIEKRKFISPNLKKIRDLEKYPNYSFINDLQCVIFPDGKRKIVSSGAERWRGEGGKFLGSLRVQPWDLDKKNSKTLNRYYTHKIHHRLPIYSFVVAFPWIICGDNGGNITYWNVTRESEVEYTYPDYGKKFDIFGRYVANEDIENSEPVEDEPGTKRKFITFEKERDFKLLKDEKEGFIMKIIVHGDDLLVFSRVIEKESVCVIKNFRDENYEIETLTGVEYYDLQLDKIAVLKTDANIIVVTGGFKYFIHLINIKERKIEKRFEERIGVSHRSMIENVHGLLTYICPKKKKEKILIATDQDAVVIWNLEGIAEKRFQSEETIRSFLPITSSLILCGGNRRSLHLLDLKNETFEIQMRGEGLTVSLMSLLDVDEKNKGRGIFCMNVDEYITVYSYTVEEEEHKESNIYVKYEILKEGKE